jgi:hypothetical protein
MGLAISIGLALLIVIFETAFPHMAVLGQVNNSSVFRCVRGGAAEGAGEAAGFERRGFGRG